MDQNNSQPFGSAQDKPFGSNQNSPQVPSSPQTPEIKLRTMESDVSSVEKTGGSAPVPEFIGPLLKPETQTPGIVSKEEVTETSGSSKKALLWLFALLIIGAVAVGGYYYVWPLFSETVMSLFNNAPMADVTEQAPSPAPTPAPVLSLSHKSHFRFSNDSLTKVMISDYSIISILTALQNAVSSPANSGELKEIFLTDANKSPIIFSEYASALMPELATSNLKTALKEVFEDDFTAYLYYDDKGVWPGYVVSKKPSAEVDMITLNNALGGLEYSSFNNLFLSPPGNASPFRTGQVKNLYSDRFVPLSQPGASFNYGMFNNYLIINTSYGGLLKALELLGL